MLKRKSIILSVLVVASLNCSQPYGTVKAGEEEFKEIREGKPTKDALAIKVYRNQDTLCVYAVSQHYTWNCSDDTREFITNSKRDKLVAAYSGSGNQICPEAILLFKNSPGCWEVDSGDGNTYHVPRG